MLSGSYVECSLVTSCTIYGAYTGTKAYMLVLLSFRRIFYYEAGNELLYNKGRMLQTEKKEHLFGGGSPCLRGGAQPTHCTAGEAFRWPILKFVSEASADATKHSRSFNRA